MKIIHICGYSAVGKNFLIKKLLNSKDKKEADRSEYERYLITRFGIEDRFDVVGPESSRRNIKIDDVREKIDKCVQESSTETLIHHYQASSLCIFNFAKEKLPDYQHKTFIIWLDPLQHLTNAVKNRPGDQYMLWSIYHLKNRFLHTTKIVLKSVIEAHKETEEKIDGNFDIEQIPDLLEANNIEVVTPVVSPRYKDGQYLYVPVDNESLRVIFRDATYKPEEACIVKVKPSEHSDK